MTNTPERAPMPRIVVDIPFGRTSGRFVSVARATSSRSGSAALKTFSFSQADVLNGLRHQFDRVTSRPYEGPFENPVITPVSGTSGRFPDKVRFGNSKHVAELSDSQLLELLFALYETEATHLSRKESSDNSATVKRIVDALRANSTVVLHFEL